MNRRSLFSDIAPVGAVIFVRRTSDISAVRK